MKDLSMKVFDSSLRLKWKRSFT